MAGGGAVGGVGGAAAVVGAGAIGAVGASAAVASGGGLKPSALSAHSPSSVVKLSAAGMALAGAHPAGLAGALPLDAAHSTLGLYGPSGTLCPGQALGLAQSQCVGPSKAIAELAELALLLLLLDNRKDGCITELAIVELARMAPL